MNTSNTNGLTRQRNHSSSSTMIHHCYSRLSPKVPRVREDSPNAVVRPSPPSSMPNLESLIEEDEDISSSSLTNNEQPSLISTILRKQNSYQTINKHQIVLPTIIESTDHEIMIDNEQHQNDKNILNNESINHRHIVKLKRQDSLNTNYNQLINVDIERKERTLNTNKNNEMMMEFTLDKRINELLQERNQRQNKVRQIRIGFATSTCQ
jgi:hypothetical protein